MDGYTSLDVQASVQHSMVLGFRNVGGIVGFNATQAGINVFIERTLIDGQVFGVFNVGGVLGVTMFDFMTGSMGQVKLNRLVILNEVQNIQLGLYFDAPFPIVIGTNFSMLEGFFETDLAGRIIGSAYAQVTLTQIIVLEDTVETGIKRYDGLSNDFMYLEDRVSGQYQAFGYGQAIDGIYWMESINEAFVDDVLVMDRLTYEENVWGLSTVMFSLPNLLDDLGKRVFFESYLEEVYLNYFII